MTRKGKIARLPHSTRAILNAKLRNGVPGTKLVEWLNGLEIVQLVLKAEFEGRPINEQNLTEWKQGGYEDWLRQQETRQWVCELAEEAAELEQEAGDFSVADWLSSSLGVALGRYLQIVAAQAADDPKQRQALFELSREIGRLRRDDHDEQRVKIEREQWDAMQEEAAAKTRPDPLLGPIYRQLTARTLADFLKEDVEEHGGYLTPEAKAFLAVTGRTPAVQKEPAQPTGDQTESK